METKNCTKCKQNQPLDNFHKSPNGKFGRVTRCKNCRITIEKDFYSKLTKQQKQHKFDKIKKYIELNKDNLREKRRIAVKNRRDKDPLFKLSGNLRNLIKNGFLNSKEKGFSSKGRKTKEILGCSFEEFKNYLENQFDENMNWENQGSYWTLDHIKPVSLRLLKKNCIL